MSLLVTDEVPLPPASYVVIPPTDSKHVLREFFFLTAAEKFAAKIGGKVEPIGEYLGRLNSMLKAAEREIQERYHKR